MYLNRNLLLLSLLPCLQVRASSVLFRKKSLSVDSISFGENVRRNQTSAKDVLSCARKTHAIYNMEDSGVFCFKDEVCLVSDCPYGAVEGTTEDGWSCFAKVPTITTVLFYTAHVAAERLSYAVEKFNDGLYYFYLPGATHKMYQEAKDLCTQVMGFDLPIFITKKQFEVAKIIYDKIPGDFWLGMDLIDGEHVWQNGVKFSVTTENTGEVVHLGEGTAAKFHFASKQFHDHNPGYVNHVVCQANLDQIDMLEEVP